MLVQPPAMVQPPWRREIRALADRPATRRAMADVPGLAGRGGRLRRDSVSVPLSGASAGWVDPVPLPGVSRRRRSPTGVIPPATAAKSCGRDLRHVIVVNTLRRPRVKN